jgi:hypothetical protein
VRESDLRGWVTKTCRPLDARPTENPADIGFPDVVMLHDITLELKYLKNFPAREKTIVQLEHYTPEQRVWARRRWRKGGNHGLLLGVGRELLLFAGPASWEDVGYLTRGELYEAAWYRWDRRPKNGDEFINVLKGMRDAND